MDLEKQLAEDMKDWYERFTVWADGPDDIYRMPKKPHFPIEWQTARCKYCKYKGLVWRKHDSKWFLYTPSQELHRCKAGRKAIRELKRDNPR